MTGTQTARGQVLGVGRVRIHAAIELVETPRHLAGHFQMRQLLLADRHQGRAEPTA